MTMWENTIRQRAPLWACLGLLLLLGGCGGNVSVPPLNPTEPSAMPSLSPPIPGDLRPLPGLNQPDPIRAGRLPNRSPYPLFTMTSEKIQGDPINLIFITTQADLVTALRQAGWLVADPLNASTKARLIRSYLLRIPYPTAPVSDLFCLGRVQDLAFEKNSEDTRKRDHFRVWKTGDTGSLDRPIWVGAATKDIDTKINPNTGLPTHKVDPNIDAERNLVASDLQAAGRVDDRYSIHGVGKPFSGTNGGDDYVYSDGLITVLSLHP